jgi:hypothetical protein
MMWHVVFAEQGGLPKSRAVKSREAAIQAACELLAKSPQAGALMQINVQYRSPDWSLQTKPGIL